MFSMMPVPDGEDPQEYYRKMQQEHQQQHDEAVMKSQDESHRIWDFIGGISVDELRIFQTILRRVEESPDQLFTLSGMIAGRLKYELNLCPGCGKDHFSELLPQGKTDASSE